MIRLEDIIQELKAHQPDADFNLVRRAYVFSASAHRGQTRHSGEPYLVHPLEVSHGPLFIVLAHGAEAGVEAQRDLVRVAPQQPLKQLQRLIGVAQGEVAEAKHPLGERVARPGLEQGAGHRQGPLRVAALQEPGRLGQPAIVGIGHDWQLS